MGVTKCANWCEWQDEDIRNRWENCCFKPLLLLHIMRNKVQRLRVIEDKHVNALIGVISENHSINEVELSVHDFSKLIAILGVIRKNKNITILTVTSSPKNDLCSQLFKFEENRNLKYLSIHNGLRYSNLYYLNLLKLRRPDIDIDPLPLLNS